MVKALAVSILSGMLLHQAVQQPVHSSTPSPQSQTVAPGGAPAVSIHQTGNLSLYAPGTTVTPEDTKGSSIVRHRDGTRTIIEPGKPPRTEPDPDKTPLPWILANTGEPVAVQSIYGRVDRLSDAEWAKLIKLRQAVREAEYEIVQAHLKLLATEQGVTYELNEKGEFTYTSSPNQWFPYEFRGQFLLFKLPDSDSKGETFDSSGITVTGGGDPLRYHSPGPQ